MDLIGRTLGDYEITGFLGRGGMAEVYRARHRLGHSVALKVVTACLRTDLEARRRFRNECQIIHELRHPGIVEIQEFREVSDVQFYAMALLEHPTLESLLHDAGGSPRRLSVARAIRILLDLLEVLEFLAQHAIVHRDIKPSNIFVTPADRVILTDFGLAKAAGVHLAITTRITREGAILGTVQYMAPELVTGGEAGPETDLFSSALVLFRCTCGRLPYSNDLARLVYEKMDPRHPVAPTRYDPGVSSDLAAVLERACSHDPAERFPAVRDLRAAILSIGTGGDGPWPGRPAAPCASGAADSVRTPGPWGFPVVLVGLLLALLILGFCWVGAGDGALVPRTYPVPDDEGPSGLEVIPETP